MQPKMAWMQTLLLLVCALGISCMRVSASQQETHNPLERIKLYAASHAPESSIVLRLNSTVLEAGHSHQWFELSWSGVQQPSYADWLGLIVPAGADITKTAPAKYQIAAMDKNHVKRGEGRLKFRLINYRSDMQFALFRGGMMAPQLAALSPIIRVQNPNEPLQRHLALTGDNTQMMVQWVTKNSSNPTVKWGTSPGAYNHSAAAVSSTYSRQELCGPPANDAGFVDPGLFHAALVEGLTPGQRYYYVVGDEEWGFSPEASFVAAPPVGPQTRVKVLAVADLGQGEVDGSMEQSEMLVSLNTTARMLQDIQQHDFQLLVHNGDISYARGYVTQWDNFMHQMEPLVSSVPYMTTHGNHERDWPNSGDRFIEAYDSGGECGIPLERRMVMPQAGRDKPWYSFDFGPIHFTQYSTEHPFHPGSEQHAWLLADLAAVDRSVTPWVIVGGHRPIYIASTFNMPDQGDQPVAIALRAAFEEAFVEHRVDLTLHGHHHSYQRTCPVNDNRCQDTPQQEPAPSHSSSSSSWHDARSFSSRRRQGGPPRVIHDAPAPVHLVIGHAGADLSLNVDLNPPDIWEVIKLWWGYLRIEASATELKCEVVSDMDSSLMDAFVLTKPQGWGAAQMQQRSAKQQQQQQQQRHAGEGVPGGVQAGDVRVAEQ
uniref:Purple acid phosphatase n=1 Tax=Tetradesmus obliquus TaxID=3088 RepID=A0A383VVS5_TETOB|eukprot:jgi/Sobl393_1/7704/SZX68526.1